jgi:hypothetical protein
MGCGCGISTNTNLRTSSKGEPYIDLTGKMVLDKSGTQLLILEPIFDAYKDIIGYTVKNLEQKVLRIFAKDIEKVLE